MHKNLRRLLAAALLFAVAAPPPLRADESAAGYAAQVAPLLPAVASVKTIANTPQGRMYFDGSGFVIDPSGIIVTNRHVIAGAYQIAVVLPGIGRLPAKPLYINGVIDLALLKVDAGRPLPALTLGDSDKVRVGDEVLLLGNPLGVGLSVSHGVISALNRDIGESMYDHFFQTDGALNHGNSGGPMVNMKGEVIAIDTALDSSPGNTGSVGIGFAMPINDAKFVIDQFLRDGRVTAGSVGVQAQHIDADLAAALGLRRPHGLVVTEVDAAGPAAGRIAVGDIVLGVAGQEASDAREMARLVAATPPGRSLDVRLLRHGAERTVTVTVRAEHVDPKAAMALLGHMPADAKPYASPSDPGMTLAALTGEMRRHLGLGADESGVAVRTVARDSAAAQRRIVAGDVIVAIGDAKVTAPEDVARLLRDTVAAGQPFAALLVRGAHGPRWVALPVERDR